MKLSHTQYMSTGCVGWCVNGDASVTSVIPVYIINSSPLTGENTLTKYEAFHRMYIIIVYVKLYVQHWYGGKVYHACIQLGNIRTTRHRP